MIFYSKEEYNKLIDEIKTNKCCDENKYYHPAYLVNILEDIFKCSFDDIKKQVKKSTITVNKKEIEDFLNKKYEEYTYNQMHTVGDNVIAKRYQFEPYTLLYFQKYINILKHKSIQLIRIIEKLSRKDCHLIEETLEELDIVLDENRNISKIDIIRLLKPTIYNIELLIEKVQQANNLNTYLDFKISEDIVYKYGHSEDELYPYQTLQVKNLYLNVVNGNVPLSKKQEQELIEDKNKTISYTSNIILNLFD